MSVPLDQPVRLTFNTYSDSARTTLADATTVTLDILNPDATTTTKTLTTGVVHESTGVYHYDVPPTAAGDYRYHWRSTGTVTTSQDGLFTVRPKYDWALVSLEDVKTRLNIPAADTTQDTQLQDYIDSAVTVLQNLYGDIIPTQYTETLRPYGDGTHLLTGRSPLLSVNSITVTWPYPSSPTINLSTNLYFTDLATGEITVFAFSPAFAWQYALRDWSTARFLVTYTAGRTAVTPNVKDAVLELLRINYSPQRAGGYYPRQGSSEDPDEGFTYLGYYIPNGVHERLAAGERPRQIA